MIVGDSGNPNSPITLSPVWSSENSEERYLKKRNQWYHLVFWVYGSSASKQMMFRIGELNQGSANPFYYSTTSLDIHQSSSTSITVTQNDLTTSTKLYIGGFPAVGVFSANTNFGGCGQLKNVVFMPHYQPSDTSDANILYNHMFEIDKATPQKIHAYNFRIKNVPALNLIKECDVPSLVQLNMQSTDNAYSQKGIQFGYGDYYECVNNNMVPTGDVVFTLKFYFSEVPSEEINLFSMIYQQHKNFFSTGLENGKLPVHFKLIKLGLFLCPDSKLKLYHMGLPQKLSYQYNTNTGYTVAIVAKLIPDTFYSGPLEGNRLFIVYVDGVRSESFTLKGNFGVFNDSVNNTLRNHYFYMGDYTSRSINRHNYAFVTPNPLNNFGPPSSERLFTSPIIFMQDLLIYENATLTAETGLLPSNCLLGVPGTEECIKCASGYSLTPKYACTLKSSLASYIVHSNNYDLTIECGDGLFFNTALNFCQNCPSGCAFCNSITDCVIKTTGCISNCAQCYQNGTCLSCNSGYALNSGTNACTQCIISSGTNPCYSCDASAPLVCHRCFDGFFLNNGTNGCDSCSAVLSIKFSSVKHARSRRMSAHPALAVIQINTSQVPLALPYPLECSYGSRSPSLGTAFLHVQPARLLRFQNVPPATQTISQC